MWTCQKDIPQGHMLGPGGVDVDCEGAGEDCEGGEDEEDEEGRASGTRPSPTHPLPSQPHLPSHVVTFSGEPSSSSSLVRGTGSAGSVAARRLLLLRQMSEGQLSEAGDRDTASVCEEEEGEGEGEAAAHVQLPLQLSSPLNSPGVACSR